MIEYEFYKNNNCNIDMHRIHISSHCLNKLFIMLDNNYIKSELAIKICKYRLKIMKEIVCNSKILENYVSNYISNYLKKN